LPCSDYWPAESHAGTQAFTATASGSDVDLPIDLDSDSCFTAPNGARVCTDYSGHDTFAGQRSPGGRFTGQNVTEYDPVSGTGCNIIGVGPVPITTCTLTGGNEKGCAFESVGGSEVQRDDSTGDLLFATVSSANLCLDLSSGPPFNFTIKNTKTITGGTGKNAGATGTFTISRHGQGLMFDAAGHGFSWFEDTSSGTITTP